jgi:hypothetical protein
VRAGCDKHPEFKWECIDCWYQESSRLRTALELISLSEGLPERVGEIARKALRGEKE